MVDWDCAVRRQLRRRRRSAGLGLLGQAIQPSVLIHNARAGGRRLGTGEGQPSEANQQGAPEIAFTHPQRPPLPLKGRRQSQPMRWPRDATQPGFQ